MIREWNNRRTNAQNHARMNFAMRERIAIGFRTISQIIRRHCKHNYKINSLFMQKMPKFPKST